MYWLVNVEHVGMIVPGPRVEDCVFRVTSHVTRSILSEGGRNRWGPWTTLKPERERSIGGIISSFEEPEECVNVIVTAFSAVCWKVDIASV